MSEHTITATSRNDEGKGASRRLRRHALVPAVIYGGHAEPRSIQLEHEKTWVASQNEWFYASILSLELDGKTERVLLRDMQRHPYKQQIMHIDFQRVSANEAVRMNVPLHFINGDTSPAGKAADVALTHEMNEIEVSCLPADLPEFIEVDLGEMQVGDTVHLSDVKFPKGVESTLKVDDEHNPAVAVARFVKEEIEEEVIDAEGAEVPASKQDDAATGGSEA
ncbi:MAG TPA: 50S ribosomal protein L25/general stress protein Ctc [Luteimonas sp.]|nr:50S ribosomal protein L25/general stress protein Ctc [Luteimonas sp.]